MNNRKAEHTRTSARVIRAGDATALVALPDWYHGAILARTMTSVSAAGDV